MKSKIIMHNGKEYFVESTAEEIINSKNSTNNGFMEITDYRFDKKVHININEISSIEPFKEPEFGIHWV